MNSTWKQSTLALTVVLGLCLADAGYGIVRHNGADDQDYIDYGNLFPSTVMAGYTSTQWTSISASGVVIDPHWVVCSAHQYFDDSGHPKYLSALIGTGSNGWTDRGEWLAVDEWFCHPNYDGRFNSDIALLYFEDPIQGVEPATRFRGSLREGDSVSIVGFGDYGTPTTGYIDTDCQRRGCQNIIDELDGAPGLWFGYPDHTIISEFYAPGESYYNALGGVGGPGDSGGGWYDEDGLLIGIMSGGEGPGYDGYSVGMDVTYFNDWIDGIQASIPELSAFVLLFFAAVAVLPFRGRRRV